MHVTATLPLPVRIFQCGDVANAPADMQYLKDYPAHVRIFGLASTECNSVSKASHANFPEGTSGLHTPPSDTFHPTYEALKILQDARGIENLVVLAELPDCAHDMDTRELNDKLGAAFIVRATDYGDASRNRHLRSNPVVRQPDIKRYSKVRQVDRVLIDGSRWAPSDPARRAGNGFPVVLRRYFTKLTDDHLMGREMRHFEQLTLNSLITVNQAGEKQYAGPTFYLDHFGLTGTPVNKSLEMYPCLQHCDQWGNAVASNAPNYYVCGRQIFCRPCKEIIHLTGGCWHLPSMTDAVTTVLFAALNHWTSVSQATWMPYKIDAHKCGRQCPKNAKGDKVW